MGMGNCPNDMNRRTIVVGGAGIAAAMAGCIGVIRGEPLEVTASALSVPAAVLEETGYEFVDLREVLIEREFEVLGRTQEVRATNHQAEYEKAVDAGPLGSIRGAVFTALSTPSVSILGREFNPVGDMSHEELAEMVQDQYDGIEDLSREGSETVTVAGTETEVGIFTARGEHTGDLLDLYLHISEAVPLGEDLVVTVGAYPEMVEEGENIRTMMTAVESED